MRKSGSLSRWASLVALVVLAGVASYEYRTRLGPWLARDGIAVAGGVGLLGVLIASWVRVYRRRASWARVWAARGPQAHHRFLVLWWGATALGMTLLVVGLLGPLALMLRLIFALLAVPFAVLLLDTARTARAALPLAAVGALGCTCCAYLVLTVPGQHPHVALLAYVGALAAGGAAVTRIGQDAAGAGPSHRGPNEALQTDQRE